MNEITKTDYQIHVQNKLPINHTEYSNERLD